MKPETFHPKFPDLFEGSRPVWGRGNSIVSLHLLASIPLFTLLPEGSEDRKRQENEYWWHMQSQYNAMQETYDKYCFVGTVWKGSTSASAKITKISISEKEAYVCYKASDEHVKQVAAENKKYNTKYKTIASGRFSLSSFLSAIQNGTVNIISTPNKK